MTRARQTGFTLIELLITLAVVGIISAIAVPSYRAYVTKAKRSEARSALLDIAQLQERYFTNNNAYLAMSAPTAAAPAGWRNYVGSSLATRTYNLSVTITATTFTASAAPYTTLFTDTECGTLSITNQGIRGKTGTKSVDDCWR